MQHVFITPHKFPPQDFYGKFDPALLHSKQKTSEQLSSDPRKFMQGRQDL